MTTSNAPSSAFDVVGIGAATIDILSVIEHFPDGDSVQPAHASGISGGGPVATALCSAAKQGCRCALIDSIGDDWIGERILDSLHASNVDDSLVTVQDGSTSSLSTVLVRRSDASRAISFAPASTGAPPISPAAALAIASARALHINGRHLDSCSSAITIAQQHQTTISFDGGAGRFRPEISALLAASNIPVVSRHFAVAATGIDDPALAACELAKSPAADFAIVTDGIHGSWLANSGSPTHHQPAFVHPDTVDTTGAGDVFHGAFLAQFLAGTTPQSAQRYASATAALSTTALGGQSAIPCSSAVTEFLDKFPEK